MSASCDSHVINFLNDYTRSLPNVEQHLVCCLGRKIFYSH